MRAFQETFARLGLDAWWVLESADVRYLTGFAGEESTLLVTAETSRLLTDSRYVEAAEKEARVDEIVCRRGPMAAVCASLCKKAGVGRVGVAAPALRYVDWLSFRAAAPGIEVKGEGAGPLEKMRARKDPDEIHTIKQAVLVAEKGFQAFLGALAQGRSERWLAARLEYELRVAGADRAAFDCICAIGATASRPHAEPGDEVVTDECCLLFDWGARLDGYHSDLTRVIYRNRMPSQSEELSKVVLEAQQAALGHVRPGATCMEVDRAARAVVSKAGYGRYFGHALGHGVGLEVHELPRVAPGIEQVLLPGMVFTIEPGIYLPGIAGVRIEDMVVVTENGSEVLTHLPREPWCVP